MRADDEPHRRRPGRPRVVEQEREHLLTVKEYAELVRQHPLSVYRRIREGRQPGVHRIDGTIRLDPPDSL